MVADDEYPKSCKPSQTDPTDLRDVQELQKVLGVDDADDTAEDSETSVVRTDSTSERPASGCLSRTSSPSLVLRC